MLPDESKSASTAVVTRTCFCRLCLTVMALSCFSHANARIRLFLPHCVMKIILSLCPTVMVAVPLLLHGPVSSCASEHTQHHSITAMSVPGPHHIVFGWTECKYPLHSQGAFPYAMHVMETACKVCLCMQTYSHLWCCWARQHRNTAFLGRNCYVVQVLMAQTLHTYQWCHACVRTRHTSMCMCVCIYIMCIMNVCVCIYIHPHTHAYSCAQA